VGQSDPTTKAGRTSCKIRPNVLVMVFTLMMIETVTGLKMRRLEWT
jgi:hypothetical protein